MIKTISRIFGRRAPVVVDEATALGSIFVASGLLTEGQVRTVLLEQARDVAKWETFGEVAVRLNLASVDDVKRMVIRQAKARNGKAAQAKGECVDERLAKLTARMA